MERISSLERKYITDVLDNDFRSSKGSVYTKKLEDLFAKKIGVKNAISFTNGTATMHASLEAMGIGIGDEVIVPPLTMSATTFAVLQANATPVFADVDENTFTISPKDVEKKITKNTKAIIPVSLYGLSSDIDELKRLSKKNNIYILEDNAEAFLAKYKDSYVGSLGDVGSFSFQSSKHLTSGEGGIITTNDEELALKIRRIQSLGYAGLTAGKSKIEKSEIQEPGYERHICMGWNYRMSELCASVAFAQTERIDELVARRIKVGNLFNDLISDFDDILIPQKTPKGYINSYWTWAAKLREDIEWIEFRNLFKTNGGDGIYSPWMLTYKEPMMRNKNLLRREKFLNDEYWQKNTIGCCPVAEKLESKIMQFKTNYWEDESLTTQINSLRSTLKYFK